MIEKMHNQERKIQERLEKAINMLAKRRDAKKPNPVTIQAAIDKINVIELELIEKQQEIAISEDQKRCLIDGNGTY